MPKFPYIGTITFNTELSLEQKWKAIRKIPHHLCHHMGDDIFITYCIEYHKVDGEPDPEAPHVHFIVDSPRKMGSIRVRAINTFLKEAYGRSQFYLATQMKAKSWSKYLMKEVKENNKLVPDKKHYYENVCIEYLDALQMFQHKPEWYNNPYNCV